MTTLTKSDSTPLGGEWIIYFHIDIVPQVKMSYEDSIKKIGEFNTIQVCSRTFKIIQHFLEILYFKDLTVSYDDENNLLMCI